MRTILSAFSVALVGGSLIVVAQQPPPAAQPAAPPQPMSFFIASAGSGNGANLGGFFDGPRFYPVQTDIFARHTFDTTNGLTWDAMTQTDRAASAVRYASVVWDGANVTAALPGVLSLGSVEVRVLSPASIAGARQFGSANFGPSPASTSTVGSVVAAVDPVEATPGSTSTGRTAVESTVTPKPWRSASSAVGLTQ